MLKLVQGDLLSIKKGVIVHQLNAMNVMGAGIAKKIAEAFPKHLEDYVDFGTRLSDPKERMGGVIRTEIGELTIIGIVSQYDYGNSKKTGKCYTDYPSMKACLSKIAKYYKDTEVDIYLPEKIGCGLAGGDVKEVHRIIEGSIPNAILVRYNETVNDIDKKIILIDAMNLIYRSHYANINSKTENGMANGGIIGFIRYINRYLKQFDSDHMIVCLDGNSETFRSEIYSEYKKNREDVPEDLKIQFDYIKEFLKLSNIKYIEHSNYEADDLIGTLSRKAEAQGYEVLIVSGDSDMFQLVNNKTSMLYVHKDGDNIYKEKEVMKKYLGLKPKQLIDFKAIVGDPGDNIPGIKGIGEKTALPLLKKYETLENIYNNIEEITGKRKEKLIEGEEAVFICKSLTEIRCNVEINLEYLFTENMINTVSDEVLMFMEGIDITPELVGIRNTTINSGKTVKVLECSSKGNKNFSAFFAYVPVFGEVLSIEDHYQLCKRFGSEKPKTWKDAKGRKPTHINIAGHDLDSNYLSQYYKLLWCKYLDLRGDLVTYAGKYDDFTDMFRGESVNCQADVIKQYIKNGRKSIIDDCSELLAIMTGWKHE